MDKILEDGASIIDKQSHSASQKLNSAIYSGTVWHQRLSPKRHAFNYRVFMMYLDLSELDQVFSGNVFWSNNRWSPARFKRSDFFGDTTQPLTDTVRDLKHVSPESVEIEL